MKSPQIINAFRNVRRADFVPKEFKKEAYSNMPVPIPGNMTTSQPSTIAFMIELLEPAPGQRILEIGTGSGYLTALLAEITGNTGRVCSIEILPELKKFAESNLKKYAYQNIAQYLGSGKGGLPEEASFDKIISGAEIADIPDAWKDQLKIDGCIVTPSKGQILKAIKIRHKKFKLDRFPYYDFVKML